MKNSPKSPYLPDDDSVTYVEGLGFVPAGGGKPLARQIRMMSNVMCLVLILYFFLHRALSLPATYLAAIVGFDVSINRFTGLITSTQFSRAAIAMLEDVFSLLFILLLMAYIYRHAIAAAHIFRRGHKGINAIAIPILVAAGVLSFALGGLFEEMNDFIGLVFDRIPAPITELTPAVWMTFGSGLMLAFLQELLFRGAVLTPLRRFGDEFAMLISALVSAFWSNGPVNAVTNFLFGLCAAYFVIRSGSVWTAVYGRLLLETVQFAFRCMQGLLEHQLAMGIIMGSCILLIILASIAYIRFIQTDEGAFRLASDGSCMRTYSKVGLFCTSLSFLLLVLTMVIKIAGTVQMIGW